MYQYIIIITHHNFSKMIQHEQPKKNFFLLTREQKRKKISNDKFNQYYETFNPLYSSLCRRNYCRLNLKNFCVFVILDRDSANAVPTIKNCTPEISTLGIFARVSSTVVQWESLALEEPPS